MGNDTTKNLLKLAEFLDNHLDNYEQSGWFYIEVIDNYSTDVRALATEPLP